MLVHFSIIIINWKKNHIDHKRIALKIRKETEMKHKMEILPIVSGFRVSPWFISLYSEAGLQNMILYDLFVSLHH